MKQALVSEFPGNADYRIHLAHSHLGHSYIAQASERTPVAEQAAAQATTLLNDLATEAQTTEHRALSAALESELHERPDLAMTKLAWSTGVIVAVKRA